MFITERCRYQEREERGGGEEALHSLHSFEGYAESLRIIFTSL